MHKKPAKRCGGVTKEDQSLSAGVEDGFEKKSKFRDIETWTLEGNGYKRLGGVLSLGAKSKTLASSSLW